MENKKIKCYDLTIPQENIWLIEQLQENSTINNVYGTFFIHKSLDLAILKKAINKIIENNDALRIRIEQQNSKPVQYIEPYEYDDLPVYFLDEDDETKIQEIINTIGLEHISILNHKLYDLRLISTPSSVYVCIKMHHIIADAWSMGQIFIENIQKYYTEIEENRVVDKKTSYLDYVKKTTEYKSSDKYLRDMKFWQKYVKNISYKNQFEMVKDKKNKRIIKTIDASLHRKIKTFCDTHNVSEFAFFLGVISIYFSKISAQENVVIGTPFLNRQKAQKELEIMGMFVATLPISIQVQQDLNFVELCKQITSTNLSCFKHSGFPYQEIQKEYIHVSGQNTNLYEIAFSYQMNHLEEDFDCTMYKTTWLPNNVQVNPLVISYVNHFGEQELCYDYLLSIFHETDIDNLHERFVYIMEQIFKNNDCIIQNIKILSKNDIALLERFNDTGTFPSVEDTVVSQFEKMVAKNKSKTALIYKDFSMSYQEFNKKINAVANRLIELGIKKCTPISMIFDKSPEMFITMLAIQKAGCYFIPILPEEEQERAEFIIKNSESQALIVEKKYSTQISKNIISNQFVIDDLLNGDTKNPNLNIKQSDLCYMIYTSGSTGTPKGVMITHKNLVSLMVSMNLTEDLKYQPTDISLSLLKYSFDGSAFDTFSTFLNGGTLVIVPKEIELNPELVAKLIEKEQVTRFLSVPTWADRIQNISKTNKIDLSSVRLINLGGETLKPQKFKYLYETYPNLKLYNLYGPTETTILTTMHKLTSTDIENNYAPIGFPIPGSRMLIMNKYNEIMPVNTKGELVIFQEQNSLNNIGNGYYHLEEKTKASFIKFVNPITNKTVLGYKTGDMAKINANFEVDFLGRNDDFKKINGGYLVSLTEVETKIQKNLGNSFDVAVVCIPIRNINSLVLFIEKKSDSINISIEDIKNEIHQNLTFYMRPKKIIEIEKIPITNNGKSNKKLLEQKALEYVQEKNILIEPANKTEQKIYDMIKEIIGFDFSTTDDFEEDLGIDSLNIAILYSKLNNNKISIQDLYTYPTVKDLAYLLKKEFSAEDDLIETQPVEIRNASNQMDLENVLLTGSTGFVGSHILHELAHNGITKKIYCIVRQKLNLNSEERFDKIIHTYFDEDTCKIIKKKTIIVNGDLRKENLGLELNLYHKIFKNVTTIINTAANVKHIGKYNISYADNVTTVQNLIKACLEFNISLAHISTLSLNGYQTGKGNKTFTENTLNIQQSFSKNPYLISKFEAEQCILKNICENNLNAKIFRIGNIMPRISDYKFQLNYIENGFLLGITSLNSLGCYTEEIQKAKLFLTPVDECSKAICKILENNYANTIYHIESDKKVNFSSIIHILKERNDNFDMTTEDKFNKKINQNYSIGIEYLKRITELHASKYDTTITLDILKKLDFEWSPISKEYLENIINISMKIKKGE